MPAGKATCLDDVSPSRLLKAAACHISQPFTHIMNLGLRLGIVPERWKHTGADPAAGKGGGGGKLLTNDGGSRGLAPGGGRGAEPPCVGKF